ncbi:MAG: hypothetical protein ACP5NY_03905 [Thermocladium sp.]
MNGGNDVFDELVQLLSANALPLALIIVLSLLIGIFSQLLHVTQYIYASLPLLFIGLIIYVLLVPVLRIYVQEKLLTCHHANILLAAVLGLIEFIVAGAEFYQSPYMELSSLAVIVILMLAIYRKTVVDSSCMAAPVIIIKVMPEGGVVSEKRIQVKSPVTIGGPGSTVVVPVNDEWIKIVPRSGLLIITSKGGKMEIEGSLTDISGEVQLINSATIWLGQTKIIIRKA